MKTIDEEGYLGILEYHTVKEKKMKTEMKKFDKIWFWSGKMESWPTKRVKQEGSETPRNA